MYVCIFYALLTNILHSCYCNMYTSTYLSMYAGYNKQSPAQRTSFRCYPTRKHFLQPLRISAAVVAFVKVLNNTSGRTSTIPIKDTYINTYVYAYLYVKRCWSPTIQFKENCIYFEILFWPPSVGLGNIFKEILICLCFILGSQLKIL